LNNEYTLKKKMKDMNVKHVLLEVSTSGRGRVNREVKGE
jgi:hypothetical protein